jgi:hypothetical protein
MYYIITIVKGKSTILGIYGWDNPELLAANLEIIQSIRTNVEYCIGVRM